MFERILVCLDGSELAEQILPYAREEAVKLGSTLILLHVVHEPVATGLNLPGLPGLPVETGGLVKHLGSHSIEADKYLKSMADKMSDSGIAVEYVVLTGHAGEVILDYAVKNNIGLVAVASHGRGGLGRAIFGSVAEYILRNSRVPVLLIRPTGLSAREKKPLD